MKYLFVLCVVLPVTLFAQTSEWGAFNQRIYVKAFAKKRFRLQAAVKVQRIDTTAKAALWARVDKPGNKRGFFYNMSDKPIKDNLWQVYSFEGKIDKDAEYLVFGGLYFNKGTFLFDDFKLSIETSENKFEEFKIPNGNFENDSLIGWYYDKTSSFFTCSITNETPNDGKNALEVDGSNSRKLFKYGDNDSIGKYANINNVKLYYEEYGAGEPLLLLHGNSQSIEAFTYQIPEFSKNYRIISVDTRGQGKSTEDGKAFTYDLFAADMNSFLDYLKLDSVNIVGWSDGGNTGLIMAMKYPRKVKRLVTMGANVFINKSAVVKGLIPAINKAIERVSQDTTYTAKKSVRLLTMLLTEPRYQFDDLKVIQSPVLVLAGEKDLVKAKHTKGIAASIPRGTLLIAPKESHYFPANNSKVFNRIVLDYLKKTD
jgi:pimeloyl-ACP methyl ester carboxylesterase